ncbi:M48 family metallopeptidase [uncultured Chitinophaga sp.]|mgnify:CR=1 FL=1|jgi:Putative Zn-dependent protease, contains TPR repeats|uniref:M48 family metallopeptidase n=1 Tax=uncultured Chitinophaga sp. TaxID=339340 RepID=UPI002633F826|nr:M48 family metallopeptidase [uncultured Chitinophaga sp.]
MQTYTGKYYNGQTDAAVDADITLTAKQITITIRNAADAARQVHWFWEQVRQVKGEAGTVLEYPGYPLQRITVHALTFADAAAFYLERKKKPGFFANKGKLLVVSIFLFLVTVLLLAYLWFIPFLAVRIANNVPVSYEEKLGQSSYDALIKEYRIKPEATKLVNEFFGQMKVQTPYSVEITVVEDKQSNAFALPGGHIIVYDHLLQNMQHYEELAALLSHEYAHIEKKHTTKTIFRSMGTYMLISLLFGDLGGAGAVVVENANSLKSLQYSRRLEKEADLYGLQLLQERHIDPRGFEWLFNTLKQGNSLQPSEWLSSHPDLNNRIRYINREMQPGPAITDSTLLRIFISLKQ